MPNESDNAAARAEAPGPCIFELPPAPAPARGCWLSKLVASLGRGDAPRATGGVVPKLLVGTGEARRAVASARGTDPTTESPRGRPLAGEDERIIGLDFAFASGEVMIGL